MKKILVVFMAAAAFMLGGCSWYYKDVTTQDYATVQMITTGDEFHWNDAGQFNIYDYSGGCNNMVDLGAVGVRGGGESNVAKVAANKPLLFRVKYFNNHGANTQTDYTDFILVPENKGKYIIEYEKALVDDEVVSRYNVFMVKGEKRVEIPEKEFKAFSSRDCM